MLITCGGCQGRKLVSPLGGMPLPCAICKGVGFIDTKPAIIKEKIKPIAPPNPIPDITLQKEPENEEELKKVFHKKMVKKRTSKRQQIREALRKIGNTEKNSIEKRV